MNAPWGLIMCLSMKLLNLLILIVTRLDYDFQGDKLT